MIILAAAGLITVINVLIIIYWKRAESEMSKRHHEERMEILKLMKASSVSEFNAVEAPFPKSTNFMQERYAKSILKPFEDDDDE